MVELLKYKLFLNKLKRNNLRAVTLKSGTTIISIFGIE